MSKDKRPICTCGVYSYPHRIGGECNGSVFAEFHYYNIRSECEFCNCNNETSCDVATGQESIKEAECYIEACHSAPGEFLIISMEQLIK